MMLQEAVISTDDLNRFYAAKNVHGACPACGSQAWSVVDAPGGMSFTLYSHLGSGGFMNHANESIPLIVLGCGNCFALRTHAAIPVRNWLQENAPKTTDQQ